VIGTADEFKICKPPVITITNKSLYEGDTGINNMNFKIVLSNPYDTTVSLRFKTSDSTAIGVSDYTPTNVKVNIKKDRISKIVRVPIISDSIKEKNDVFKVTLSNPTNAILAETNAFGKILNDDDTASNNKSTDINYAQSINTKPDVATITLAPNPVHSSLRISGLNSIGGNSIALINVEGKVISNIKVYANVYDLDVSKFTNGIYFVKVGGNSYKFIKE
jgi:hypothetical protein